MGIQNQGVRVGSFVVAVGLALNLLSGMGVSALFGLGVAAGDGLDVSDEPEIQNPSDTGSTDGILGLTQAGVGIISVLATATTGTFDLLVSDPINMPTPIAGAIQAAIDVALALGIAAVLRGISL